MRLGNVDNQKCDLASVLFVEFVEGRNLPPEGWSGVAAEYQHNRPPLLGKRRKPNAFAFV